MSTYILHVGMSKLNEICLLIRPAKEKWEEIGLDLGLSYETLCRIKTTRKGEPGQCLYNTISDWLHHKGNSRITWRTIINTLKKVNEGALAENLMTKKGKFPLQF